MDILLQSRRDQRAAERFLRRLLRGQGQQPRITDKLRNYAAASKTIPSRSGEASRRQDDFEFPVSNQPEFVPN